MSNDLFLKELESKLASVIDSEKIETIKNHSFKYMGVNSDVSGETFFDEFVLKAAKDYPTDDMRYYQTVRELKVRVHNLFEETLSLQKKQIELDKLDLDKEDLEDILNSAETERQKKRAILELKSKEIEINQLKIQVEFAKQKVEITTREVEDFTNLCNKYSANGVKPFELARLEEMEKKIEARYLNHIVHGIPLSNPELAFYYNNDGLLVPPSGVVDKLLELGLPEHAKIEYAKIQATKGSSNLLEYKDQILGLTDERKEL